MVCPITQGDHNDDGAEVTIKSRTCGFIVRERKTNAELTELLAVERLCLEIKRSDRDGFHIRNIRDIDWIERYTAMEAE